MAAGVTVAGWEVNVGRGVSPGAVVGWGVFVGGADVAVGSLPHADTNSATTPTTRPVKNGSRYVDRLMPISPPQP